MDYLIHHFIRSSAERLPDKEAIVNGDRRMHYSQLWRSVISLAGGLRSAGIEHGDRIGILLDACIPQVISIFATSAADAAFVPINHLLFPEQIAHILVDCQVKALITTDTGLIKLAPLLTRASSLAFLVVIGHGKTPCIGLPTHSFEHLSSQDLVAHKENCRAEDLAAILYTSGSTGKPKGVMLTHGQIMAGSAIVSEYLGISQVDRILAALPFSFDAGLNQAMTAFQHGGTVVLITFSFGREVIETLANEKITGLAGVPTLWCLLTHPHALLHKVRLPWLRYITNTGGAMPQTILASLRKALPHTLIFLMYGFTEAFRSTYLPPEELDRRPTSIGKPIPNTEILIVNEDGKACGPGEVGELVHRGPTVSLGYWGKPEETNRTFRIHPFATTRDGEKVCYSGDLVKMDEEGFLYYVGRRDSMIKSCGFRISPTEIEDVLFESGAVDYAAVIGIPDETLGQHIKAFVVSDEKPVNAESLIQFCSKKLPRYMVPKTIELVDELPRTTSGKIDYAELRRREGLQY